MSAIAKQSKQAVRRTIEHRRIAHAVALCLVALLFLAVVHELIPGLHIEGSAHDGMVCPFCKLIYSPLLLVVTLIMICPMIPLLQPVWVECYHPRSVSCRPLSCRAPPAR